MTDTVKVPREATEAMYEAAYDATRLPDGTPQFAGAGFCLSHAAAIVDAAFAAAPQATDPRERHILITPDRSHVEIRDMDHAMTLLAEQNIAIDSLQSRIATLTAERDESIRGHDSCKTTCDRLRDMLAAAETERDALREAVEFCPRCKMRNDDWFLCRDAGCFMKPRAFTTQPSKTETRDDE